MRLPAPASRSLVVGVSAVAALAVAGGIVVAATRSSGSTEGVKGTTSSYPAARLHLAHLAHGRVPYAKPVTVKVANGALTAVQLTRSDGTALSGSFNARHTTWHSNREPGPLARFTGTATYVDLGHHTVHTAMTVRTKNSSKHLVAVLSPGAHDTVGIGSPIIVSFNAPVPAGRQAAVEHRLSVTTSPHVVGAWHWMTPQEVHWRPPAYWKPGTKVTVASDLSYLHISKSLWGAPGHHSTSFRIGSSHISVADVASDEMKVYDDGHLVKTLPFSAGRTEYPTKSGVHITFEKSPQIIMDSATVGIPQGSAGYYHETVYWDVRISYGGAFVHAAPWSVADQGHSNVSHGCINLSTANAEWFYHWAQRGDIVDVVNSAAAVNTADPGMADWNMTWKQWLHGDADPSAAARALHPLLPRQGEPGFAPVRHHAHHHHASKAHHSH